MSPLRQRGRQVSHSSLYVLGAKCVTAAVEELQVMRASLLCIQMTMCHFILSRFLLLMFECFIGSLFQHCIFLSFAAFKCSFLFALLQFSHTYKARLSLDTWLDLHVSEK